jgi:FixJ family two-component response regulator
VSKVPQRRACCIVGSEQHLDSNKCYPMPAQPDSICILDDDASVRNSIVQLLHSDGLTAQVFEDAEVLLAHARGHAVSLDLIDVWMPKMSGLQVQTLLREVSPDTKIIMMTGRETLAIRIAALQGGAFAFLVKPFEDEAFLCLVRQALRLAA